MRFLIASDSYPEFDRNSADFRLTQLMAAMLDHGDVHFWAAGPHRQTAAIGQEGVQRYRKALADAGIRIVTGGVRSILRQTNLDAVILEWYFSAAPYIDEIRATSPNTKVITDSVDVTFNRLQAKARVSGSPDDQREAEAVRRLELDIYRRSDLVLTVSDEDARILALADRDIRSFTIPNIHPLHDFKSQTSSPDKVLVFVGSRSQANDDAMRFFCHEVLPLILAQEPAVIFRVVGTVTLPELNESLVQSVERLGFVADTRPYLESSLISVAPLRFGGGMKGKVGEAMSLGLPVVSTSTGAEGFGIEPGREALVADDAQGFADATVKLIREPELRNKIARAGWQFIRDHYSDVAVRKRVDRLVELIAELEPKRPSLPKKTLFGARDIWKRHVAWRLR